MLDFGTARRQSRLFNLPEGVPMWTVNFGVGDMGGGVVKERTYAAMAATKPCPGPLIWFDVERGGGAVLECSTCGYVVTTGNIHDERHTDTPLLREGTVTA